MCGHFWVTNSVSLGMGGVIQLGTAYVQQLQNCYLIIMTSWWARWRLKSPSSRLLTQPFVQKTSQLRVTGLCEGNSPVTGEFSAQKGRWRGNYVSIWWRHHVNKFPLTITSWHGYAWRNVVPLWEESTGNRVRRPPGLVGFPSQRTSFAELWCFLLF